MQQLLVGKSVGTSCKGCARCISCNVYQLYRCKGCARCISCIKVVLGVSSVVMVVLGVSVAW